MFTCEQGRQCLILKVNGRIIAYCDNIKEVRGEAKEFLKLIIDKPYYEACVYLDGLDYNIIKGKEEKEQWMEYEYGFKVECAEGVPIPTCVVRHEKDVDVLVNELLN